MSRCFPFPPPGYEQKVADSVELQPAKEKQRTKKDKEKKEKEKRDRKEKKHRVKSKEKDGEKKDSKDRERHKVKDREKKKEKDRNKNKGDIEGKVEEGNFNDSKFRAELESRIRDEKGAGINQLVEATFGKAQGKYNGIDQEMASGQSRAAVGTTGILQRHRVANSLVPGSVVTGSNGIYQKNRIGSSSSFVEKGITAVEKNRFGPPDFYAEKEATTTDRKNQSRSSSFYPEKDSIAGHRNHIRPSGSLPYKDIILEKRNHIASIGFSPEKDVTIPQRNPNASLGFFPEKEATVQQSNLIACDAFSLDKDATMEQKNLSASPGLFPEKDGTAEKKIQRGPSAILPEKRKWIGFPGSFPGRDAISERNRLGTSGLVTGRDLNTEERERIGSSGFVSEKNANKKSDGKDNINVAGPSLHKIEKHKNKEQTKNKGGKEKHKDKDKKDKKIKKGEQKGTNPKHTSETIKGELKPSTQPIFSSKETEKNGNAAGVNIKRKEINGFLHEREVRPVKLQRTSPSPRIQIQNGRILEYNHVNMLHGMEVNDQNLLEPCLPAKLETVCDRKVSISETKEVNGAVQDQTLHPSNSKQLKVDAGSMINNEVIKKPPHPDTKYLNQILSVPEMDNWSEVDEQEWLFGHRDHAQQKPKMESSDMPLVWAKSLEIDGADSIALPYVIPY